MRFFGAPTMKRPPRLKELRVCWIKGLDPALEPEGGLWHPDTPGNQLKLKAIMQVGNEIFGRGTHWIEEREA